MVWLFCLYWLTDLYNVEQGSVYTLLQLPLIITVPLKACAFSFAFHMNYRKPVGVVFFVLSSALVGAGLQLMQCFISGDWSSLHAESSREAGQLQSESPPLCHTLLGTPFSKEWEGGSASTPVNQRLCSALHSSDAEACWKALYYNDTDGRPAHG